MLYIYVYVLELWAQSFIDHAQNVFIHTLPFMYNANICNLKLDTYSMYVCHQQ